MRSTYVVHILAGSLGIASGFVALYATKGARLHRRVGMVFVCAMLTTTLFGVTIAAVRGVAPAVNIPAALLTSYLAITALTTVRPPAAGGRWLDVAAMLVALAVGVTMLTFGFEALANDGKRNGMPAFPFFMFGVVGTLGSVGDIRMIRSGALRGARRRARHLWRMCFALFIAALSFSVQLAKMIPTPARIPALLALPMLAVLVTMAYWLWRVRVKGSLRGIVGVGAPQTASSTG